MILSLAFLLYSISNKDTSDKIVVRHKIWSDAGEPIPSVYCEGVL